MKRLASKMIAACSLVVVIALISWLTSVAPVKAAADSWFRRLVGKPPQTAPERSGPRERLNTRPTHAKDSFFNHLLALAPAISATLVDSFPTGFDVDGDTKADPGDKIRYTATITNGPAGTTATSLHFSDQPDANTTFVAGSVVIGPLALDETYQSVGNMTLTSSAINATCGGNPLRSLTCNDTLNGATLTGFGSMQGNANGTALGGTVTTINNGSVVLAADGTFVYNPAAGFEGADEFYYTLSNATLTPALTSTGKVTINVGGANGMVWFVTSAGGGSGRQANPIGLDAFRLVNNGTGTNPAANDTIFLFEGSHALTATLTLLNNQKVIGQDTTDLVTNLGAPSPLPGNAYPAVNNPSGTVVGITSTSTALTLGSSNNLAGFTVGNSTTAITGGAVGTLNVREVIINTNGAGLVITTSGNVGGAANFTGFTSITSSGGASNISLTGVNGTLALGSGSLSGSTAGASNHAFLVSGGDAVITYSGSVSKGNQGDIANISGKTGGGVTLSGNLTCNNGCTGITVQNNNTGNPSIIFSGATKTVNAGASDAVTVSGNTGATINFSGGGLDIDTTSGKGFDATGGGTVNVTTGGNNNTIDTDTGIGINIQTPTNIGGSGVTFRSITVDNGASNSAASGIRLNGTTGTFMVTGDGTLARNGSGGTIHKTTDDAIDLNNASNVTLQSMNLTNNGDTAPSLAVDAENTTGDQTVQINGGSNVVLSGVLIDTPTGSGYLALNLGGTNRINNNSLFTNFADGARHGIYVNNTNTNMTLFEFKNSTMNNSLNDSAMFFFANTGTSNMTLDVKGSTFENLDVQALTVAAGGTSATTGTLTSTIGGPNAADRNKFQNAHAFSVAGVNFSAENNLGVLVGNGATHNSTVENNLFDNIAEEGQIANTSIVRTQNSGGKMTVTLKDNEIRNINFQTSAGGRHVIGHVFEPVSYTSTDFTNITIDGNTANNVTYTSTNREFIFVDFRNPASKGNVTVQNNLWNMPTAGSQQAIELRFRQSNSSNVNVLVTNNGNGTKNSVTGATHNTAARYLDINAEESAHVSTTVTNNHFTDSDASGDGIAITTEDNGSVTGAGATHCANISGNILTGLNTILLDEQVEAITIQQASNAALSSANGSATVTINGTPTFNTTCTTLPTAAQPIEGDELPLRSNGQVGALFERLKGVDSHWAGYFNATGEAKVGNAPMRYEPKLVMEGTLAASATPLAETKPSWAGYVNATVGYGAVISPQLKALRQLWRPVLAAFSTPRSYLNPLRLFERTVAAAGKPAGARAMFAPVEVDLPDLPPGKSVQVVFDVTVNSRRASYTTQGAVSASGISNVLTDDPDVNVAPPDPTVTPGDCFATVNVTSNANSGAGTLRQALSNVCDGGTVTFQSGLGPITIDSELVIDRSITINNANASTIIIQRNVLVGNFRIFNINAGYTVSINGLTITAGVATAGGAGDFGGGIRNDGTLTLTNTTVSGNNANQHGGGIYSLGPLTVINSTFSGNTTNTNGAAGGGIATNGTTFITNSTFSNNSAYFGGGIFIGGGTATITNCTVSNNTATSEGGGIRNDGTANLRNTIVANNNAPTGPDLRGTYVSPSNNLVETTTGSTFSGSPTDNITGQDPNLGSLQNNGGPTQTQALLVGSPALDAGNNTFVVAPPFLNTSPITDQRGTGFPRILDAADAGTMATVDIGAFEARASVEGITDKTIAEDAMALNFNFNVGDAAQITSVTATSNNTTLVPNLVANLNVTGSGSTRNLTITPAANESGMATITVTVTAGSESMTDTFVLTVTEVNDLPDAINDSLSPVNEDSGQFAIPFTTLLGNDNKGPSNENGQTLTITTVGSAVGGAATLDTSNLQVLFTPASDFNGAASFQYTVQDNGTTSGSPDPKTDTATASFTINAVNDPVSATAPSTVSVPEDSVNFAVTGLSVSDVDVTLAPAGVYEVTLSATNGTLTLTTIVGLTFTANDGTADATMTFHGTLSNINMALATTKYTPAANYNGPAQISLQATDQFSGVVATGTGSATSDSKTITVTVTAMADTPSVGNATTNEDTQTSAMVITPNAADGAEVTHFKITAITNGTLFKSDGTTQISNNQFITVAEGGMGVKFTPAANLFSPGSSFSFTVQASVSNMDAGLGGSTATSTITVNAQNDAPMFDNTGNMSLTAINEDVADASNTGTLVSAIIASAGGDRITDVDASPLEGIAVIAVDNMNGTWQFSITGGAPWTAFGSPGASSARLLASDANTRVRFVPTANFNGTVAAGLTFHAWDQTSGMNGGTADVNTNGGTTAFSTATETASITVNAVADMPSVLSPITTNEDTQTAAIVISRNAADGNEVTHFKITSITNGTLFKNDGTTPISNGNFITYAEGNAGLKFTPAANLFSPGTSFSFTVQASVSGVDAGLAGSTVTANITVTAVADTPSVSSPITTNEDTQTSAIVINRNAVDGIEVTHFKIINITNGTLYKSDGTTQISNNGFITYNEAQMSVKFTPATNLFSPTTTFSFQVQGATDGSGGGLGSAATANITVNAVADTPSVPSPIITNEDTQTSAIVISRNAADSTEVAHFKITNITNGTLFQSNGTTQITAPAFITVAEGNAGLKFTPAANLFSPGASFSFTVQASVNGMDAGLGGSTVTANITVNPVADTPSITNATTNQDTQTTSGLVISRDAVDSSEVTHFKITNITNGTLFKNNGTTQIIAPAFITFAEGNAGLKFTPASHFAGTANFTIQASTSGSDTGLGGSTITATITVIDTENPTITCPANQVGVMTLNAPTGTKIAVNYPTPAANDNAGIQSVVCTPPSTGNQFPLGTTTVNCTATDTSSRTASCSFSVVVRTPRAAVTNLKAQVQALVPGTLNQTQANTLLSYLELGSTHLEQGNNSAACTDLANFVAQCNALGPPPGNNLMNATQRDALISYVNKIRNALGVCGGPYSPAKKAGVFAAQRGEFYLKQHLTTGLPDQVERYGEAGDLPVAGDWDGKGIDSLGVYRQGVFHLRTARLADADGNSSGAEITVEFGLPGDLPVVGDWDGDGVDTIGVYRQGQFLLRNSNRSGPPDIVINFGEAGDLPLAGDWDGDGQATVGVYNRATGLFKLSNTLKNVLADVVVQWGGPGYLPVVGDWDGDGSTTIGLYGVNGEFLLRNTNAAGTPDLVFTLGVRGGLPVAGKWGSAP